MKRLLSITVALGVVLLMATPCFAENALDKLGRGLINTATGCGEYPRQIMETSKEHNVPLGISWGQAKGIGMSVVRTGVGCYDTGTFYLPPYDRPVLDPEHLFQLFE